MKPISNKAYGVLSAWVICTGIHISAFAGWLEFPSEQAAQMYLVAWVAFTTFLAAPLVRASKVIFVMLMLVGLLGVAHSYYERGGFEASNQSVLFITFLVSVLFSTKWFSKVLKDNIELWHVTENDKAIEAKTLSYDLDIPFEESDQHWYDKKKKKKRRQYYVYQTIHGNPRL